MTLLAMLMVLISSVTQPYWNYLAKKSNGGVVFIWLTYVAGTVLLLPFFIYSLLDTELTFSFVLAGVLVISGGLRLLYFVLLQEGYRQSDLSIVFPVARGSAPLFSTIGAVAFLNEQLTFFSLSGLFLIVAGVLVITRPRINYGNLRQKAGLLYGVGAGIIISMYTVWDKNAVSNHRLSPFMLTFASNALGAALLIPPVYKRASTIPSELTKHWWPVLMVAVLSPLSYLLVLYAMKTSSVIYVAPAREISIVFAVFMGQQFMAETDSRSRLIGAGLIVAGVMALII